jgi:trimeric autotransporter adhesin
MKRRYVGLAMGAVMAVGAALSLPSCGHDQKLVGVQISPTSFTFLAPAGTEQYTATATYIHPPATKDVTAQATWAIDDGVVEISAPGLVTPTTGACGGGTISATVPEGTGGASNIMRGYATVTVNDPANPLCPGGGTVATLSVGVEGSGTVTSLPSGISCPGTCINTYDVGASVLLSANGNGFSGWINCTSATPTSPQCTVTIPAGGTAVIANFN